MCVDLVSHWFIYMLAHRCLSLALFLAQAWDTVALGVRSQKLAVALSGFGICRHVLLPRLYRRNYDIVGFDFNGIGFGWLLSSWIFDMHGSQSDTCMLSGLLGMPDATLNPNPPPPEK